MILIPLAWSSQQIDQICVLNTHTDMKFRTQLITQKEFYYPWSRTSIICPIPVLSSSLLATTGDQTINKLHRLPFPRKHESKKRRRHRSCSTSSFSRSVSSDSRKRKSKRSKHSHKKRKRRLTSSFSSTSDIQSDNYSRYKRSRHSPQAVETPIMLQPAEITNVPTIPQPEHVIQHSTKDRLRFGDGDLVLW